eukprot:4287747-Lingulodinium_polyedra.AAC.1
MGVAAAPESYHVDEDGWPFGESCGSYMYEHEENEEDSDTEDEAAWLAEQDPADVTAYLGSFEGCSYDSLLQAYLLAKRRFRHFARRAPRRERFPRRTWSLGWKGRGRSKGKGRRQYHWGEGSVVQPSSLAGGKGKGKHKGKRKDKGEPGVFFQNPVGADGLRMRCHECGSEDHL